MLLIVLGAVGLQVLSGADRRAEDQARLQQKIADYRQLQRDASLPSSWFWNERTLEAALGQLGRLRHDLDRLHFVPAAEAEALARVRADYDQLIRVLSQVLDRHRAGSVAEAKDLQLAQAGPLHFRRYVAPFGRATLRRPPVPHVRTNAEASGAGVSSGVPSAALRRRDILCT